MTVSEAAEKGKAEIVKLLLGRGVNVNKKSKNGWTGLALAKKQGHNEIVELLKRYGVKK